MTVDLLSAASDGWFSLLSAAIDPADAKVATNLEENADPPLMLLGKIDVEPFEDDDTVERLTIETIVIYRGTDRAEFHRLMNLARGALDHATPVAAGMSFGRMNFAGQTASGPGADGVTHAGSIEHEVLAQPA